MWIHTVTFLRPWWLAALVAVAAVGLWALYRPHRPIVPVGSLELWRRALAGRGASGRATRRVTLSWLILLAGATAAVMALSQPIVPTGMLRRNVAVAIYPSAEIDANEMRQAAEALLDRLDRVDRVQLVLPDVLGGPSDWLNWPEVRDRLAKLQTLPAASADLTTPAASPDAQHTYRFVAAGADVASGPAVTVIELPARLPAVGIEAFAARPLPDGTVSLFVAARNRSDRTLPARVLLHEADESGELAPARIVAEAQLAAGARGQWTATASGAPAFCVRIESGQSVGRAFLARRQAVKATVAMVGRDCPLIRRFIRVAPTLELQADANAADVIIADSVDVRSAKPALLIDPPSPPATWRKGDSVGPLLLGRADQASDDPVMQHVDLSGVAVRRARPWTTLAAFSPLKRLASIAGGGALILRTDPAASDASAARRVYVAFDLSGENTNFATTDAFVIFMDNAMRWLTRRAEPSVEYAYVTPLSAGRRADWQRLDAEADDAPAPLAQPGLYRDEAGRLHAVSLVALQANAPATPALRAVAAATLPSPMPASQPAQLWPIFAAAAGACWLGGWTLRR